MEKIIIAPPPVNPTPGLCILFDAEDLIMHHGEPHIVVPGWSLSQEQEISDAPQVKLFNCDFCLPLSYYHHGFYGYVRHLPFLMAQQLIRLRYK